MASTRKGERDGPEFSEPAPFSVRVDGLMLEFLPGGQERLEALLALIHGAQTSLRLVFYIYAEDEAGAQVRDALAEAAGRGVEVSLVLDSFGARADAAFFAPLIAAGGRYREFSPRWNVRYLVRNHQKMAIADGRKALIGGFNVENDYFASPQAGGWDDLGILLEGQAVERLDEWFGRLEGWCAERNGHFFAIRRLVREWEPGSGRVQWLMGGLTRLPNSWARRVMRDIECGTRLAMMMAYFSPGLGTVRRLGEVAQRGAALLVLAGKSDNGATIGAARSLYSRLLRRGAEIYEFRVAKLHTKLIVVDDVVYLGSANFDMRSLYLNLELMLRIEDAALAERMRQFVAAHVAGSVHVTKALHRRRGTLLNRIRWMLSWFLVTVVDYTVTRRLNLGL
jgi:cardiolipin synthase